jgi:hypothetical protein
MSKIPEQVILDWISKKKHIQDRLNRINKRLKKYNKQKIIFEMRLRMIEKFQKQTT